MAATSTIAMAETLEQVLEISKIYGPFIAGIISLVVWSWRKLEKDIAETHREFLLHVKRVDSIHRDLYDQNRLLNERLSGLVGAHNALVPFHIHEEFNTHKRIGGGADEETVEEESG